MPRLGISLYPDVSNDLKRDKEYIDLAKKYGFKRVFSNLLSVDEEMIKRIKELNLYAQNNGFEVILDVSPAVFKEFNISVDDLSFFSDMYADGIRLDEGFNGHVEANMTYNKENLMIEVNASIPSKVIDNIMSYRPYKDHLLTCHNFYPQRYTGLSLDLFEETSIAVKKHNLKIAAFVSSNNDNTFGPWPVNDGLCTLEMHRDLPLDLQVRHLYATELVDDILVANCYASEEEMKAMAIAHPGKITMKIALEEGVSDVEKEIIFEYPHYVRGDMSDYMARSTMSRIDYASAEIKPHITPKMLHRGDVVVLNEKYGRYKGELHIILNDLPNDGKINKVGSLLEEEKILLDYLGPWKHFSLIE